MVRSAYSWLDRARRSPWLRSLYVAAVIASGVHFLNKTLPLELPATTVLAGVAQVFEPASSAQTDARGNMAVVAIDDQVFEDRYDRTAPLNRCKLAEDLAALLQGNSNIRVLAIDLDLSPTKPREYQDAIRSLKQPERRLDKLDHPMHRCQYLLEEFLREASESRALSIIAISPIEPTQGAESGRQWDKERFPHIMFGDPKLETKLGMAHDYEFPPPGCCNDRPTPFAEFVTRELCRVSQRGKADGWFDQPKGCSLVPPTHHPLLSEKDFVRYPVSHFEVRHLYNRGVPTRLGDPSLACSRPGAAGQGCDIRVVLLGGTYGIEDQYLTPVGWMSGLRLHAAIAGQLRAHTSHWWGYLLDILIGGFVFGPVVHSMWGNFYRQRAGTLSGGHRSGDPRLAYWWLVGLGFVYLCIVVVATVFSVWLYVNGKAWISPLPMALAMLFESAVSGSVHAAVHKVEHEIEQARTTITGLERWISELSSTTGEGSAVQASAPHTAAAGDTPWLAFLPSLMAVALIACAVIDLSLH